MRVMPLGLTMRGYGDGIGFGVVIVVDGDVRVVDVVGFNGVVVVVGIASAAKSLSKRLNRNDVDGIVVM